jgi:hypothetical protein
LPKRILRWDLVFTLLSAQAISKNKHDSLSHECELIAIEPYPNDFLIKGFPGLSRLIIRKVQDVPLSIFASLNAGDILFIDSTHA